MLKCKHIYKKEDCMWRWTIGIVVLIGLSIPVIALATGNAQPPAPTPVRQTPSRKHAWDNLAWRLMSMPN